MMLYIRVWCARVWIQCWCAFLPYPSTYALLDDDEEAQQQLHLYYYYYQQNNNKHTTTGPTTTLARFVLVLFRQVLVLATGTANGYHRGGEQDIRDDEPLQTKKHIGK